ncbi:putative amidohydrolase [Scopulibacillus darangshiensis]|uniref:Putative amidohydrolase n=1 Tax=Scopulibacillus darangshiensis TaxID=442528 RepID=A0A4R2P4P8_9BACL|nr:carbon-nitrogen hydrolase family protein [Scopulibacillus darangshiensis]TCP29627.1 putative amidohydrolase [Scopulibacillus darangshiensis]
MNIATAQFDPVLKDKQKNLEKMIGYLKKAKKQDADLVVFPEMALTGYSVGDILPAIAETKDGESLKKLGKVCKDQKIHALVSFPEKENGAFYISSALLKDDGTTCGIYRKTHLFDTEAKYFTRGSSWPVFDTKFGKIGVMICYDLEFPEVSRLLRLNGAEVILVNTANMIPYEHHQNIYMQSRALENEVPIVICNRIGHEGELAFFGHSMAVDPEGKVIFKLDSEEGVRTAEIRLQGNRDPKLAYTNNLHTLIKKNLANVTS